MFSAFYETAQINGFSSSLYFVVFHRNNHKQIMILQILQRYCFCYNKLRFTIKRFFCISSCKQSNKTWQTSRDTNWPVIWNYNYYGIKKIWVDTFKKKYCGWKTDSISTLRILSLSSKIVRYNLSFVDPNVIVYNN